MLEVIDKGSATPSHPAPLLFVHGAYHGAWCWDEYFLDFFADKGYHALAISLRGHGGSPSPRPLRFCTLEDYVDDVRSVVADLPVKPVLVGHSMGGFIVQKYLQRDDAPAAVLMAPTSVQGSRAFTNRIMRQHPWLALRNGITGNMVNGFNTPTAARRLFYSNATAESDVVRYAAKLCNESQRVAYDALAADRPSGKSDDAGPGPRGATRRRQHPRRNDRDRNRLTAWMRKSSPTWATT